MGHVPASEQEKTIYMNRWPMECDYIGKYNGLVLREKKIYTKDECYENF
jgi:hypothetical protein